MKSYFTLSELTHSDTALQRGINNTPGPSIVLNIEELIKTLNIIREHWGAPIKVNSGYRCKALNDILPGASKTSQHMEGKAADLNAGNKNKNKQLYELIIKLKEEGIIQFTQLIDESNFTWVHLGIDKNNLKNQILKM